MLHMIGNAHLDPVWLWRWPEGCAEAIATCWSAVDRLDEHAGFVFTRGEAVIYRWIEELDPPLFARIRSLVAEGRWAIVNGWWLQPDCNLPGGEAVIRQALYGKRYFADRFGVEVTVGYNVDSFGHAATLPMLLRHTGSDSYVFMRPQAHEKALPAELFDWVAADGSTVRAFRIQLDYASGAGGPALADRIDRHRDLSAAAGHPFMCFYGVGNHGGGPTREALATIDARRGTGEPLDYSDPARFFAAVRERAAPALTDELQHHAVGCYSAVSALKALNRRAEALLGQAESAAALAWREAGAAYPGATLASLWQAVLFNQFHDTLAGSSIESACADAIHAYGGVLSGAAAVLDAAARHLARTVRRATDPRQPQFLLINANDADWHGIVELQPWTDFDAAAPLALLDEADRAVPLQPIAPEAAIRGVRRFAFATAVPAFGYRLLRFVGAPQPADQAFAEQRPLPDPAVVETAGGTLYVTAVRSPAFAHHDPMTLRGPHRTMDQGEQRFSLLLQAAPDLSRGDAWRLADALLRPPVVTPHVSRGGERPWRGQWLRPWAATSAITALKLAEDGGALVLRAVELEGRPDRLALGDQGIDVPPRGIVTARLDGGGLRRSDGLER